MSPRWSEAEVDDAQDGLMSEPVEEQHRVEVVQQFWWELLGDAI